MYQMDQGLFLKKPRQPFAKNFLIVYQKYFDLFQPHPHPHHHSFLAAKDIVVNIIKPGLSDTIRHAAYLD
jgi:hypothetical protein